MTDRSPRTDLGILRPEKIVRRNIGSTNPTDPQWEAHEALNALIAERDRLASVVENIMDAADDALRRGDAWMSSDWVSHVAHSGRLAK